MATRTALDDAIVKIGGQRFVDALPDPRDSELWEEIRTTYSLSVFELSALQKENHRRDDGEFLSC
jgi:hypothetical protein